MSEGFKGPDSENVLSFERVQDEKKRQALITTIDEIRKKMAGEVIGEGERNISHEEALSGQEKNVELSVFWFTLWEIGEEIAFLSPSQKDFHERVQEAQKRFDEGYEKVKKYLKV